MEKLALDRAWWNGFHCGLASAVAIVFLWYLAMAYFVGTPIDA